MHDCEQLCDRGLHSPGDPRRRAAARCALPDFEPGRWAEVEVDDEASMLAHDVGVSIASRDEATGHDLDTDGCPLAWVLSRFAQHLMPFLGSRDWDHPWRSSLLLEQASREPGFEVLYEAVRLYQAHVDGAYALGGSKLDG